MQEGKIVISGTGCALADFLYSPVSFGSEGFSRFFSKNPGDGGLSPGKLVFTEDLEKFSRRPYEEILNEIAGNKPPVAFNIGGPGLVSVIHASQLLGNKDFEVNFFGSLGYDKTAHLIIDKLKQTPLNLKNYRIVGNKPTPFTDVFSDPDYENGNGERTFVNNIGAAWDYAPAMLTDDFFGSHIVCFGGTALVPLIHDNLTSLLAKARLHKCITIVSTVYDFRNEKNNPGIPWPLGDGSGSYQWIDVLIMDREEALKISGQNSLAEAISWFKNTDVKSFIITNGADPVTAYSNGLLFGANGTFTFPVSSKVNGEFRKNGDTTGCGDNFTGGIIFSLAEQLKYGINNKFDLNEALSWAIASGGFTCSYLGGTYFEKEAGEKRSRIREFMNI